MKEDSRFNKIIDSLPIDDGIRCPAMVSIDGFGFQCEDSQGHKGMHWVRWKKVYFKDAEGGL